jgi:peptidoglycan hydrolase-like protein with peptidoglycan-binding domain
MMTQELFRLHPGLVGLLAATLLVAGCGDTTGDRTLSGAGIGAAAGTAVGAVTGLSLLEGAALGAVAGGATGALTDSSQVDLGQPLWKRNASTGSTAASGGPLVYDIQNGLNRLGYDAGPADGRIGPRTRGAIREYQRAYGLPETGEPSDSLLADINARLG